MSLWLFTSFPLRAIHPQAMQAAYAATCAGWQGRFEVMHNELFAIQKDLGRTSWEEVARRVGVTDIHRFNDCLQSTPVQAYVERDLQAARAAGLTGTPTVYVNNRQLPGTPDAATLVRQVKEILEIGPFANDTAIAPAAGVARTRMVPKLR